MWSDTRTGPGAATATGPAALSSEGARAERPFSPWRDRAAWPGLASIALFTISHLALAACRRLTFDEAHYLLSARAGVPWPIDYHPPLLGLLLRAVDALPLEPVELRVRVLPAVLLALTALVAGLTAARLAPRERAGLAFSLGATLCTMGLMPQAAGFLAVPEAPVVLGSALLFSFALAADQDHGGRGRWAALGLLAAAALAMLAKASALACVVAIALTLAARRRLLGAALVTLGALLVAPWSLSSVIQQSAHVAGLQAGANQRLLGALPSLLAIAAAAFVGFSPLVIVPAWRSEALTRLPGARLAVVAIAGAIGLSAVASGRMPEIHWFGPVLAPLYACGGAALALLSPGKRRVALASHLVPGLLALGVWAVPSELADTKLSFFAACPSVARSPNDPGLPWVARVRAVRSLPAYGEDAWRALYRR